MLDSMKVVAAITTDWALIDSVRGQLRRAAA
jgi:hypothetical protein